MEVLGVWLSRILLYPSYLDIIMGQRNQPLYFLTLNHNFLSLHFDYIVLVKKK